MEFSSYVPLDVFKVVVSPAAPICLTSQDVSSAYKSNRTVMVICQHVSVGGDDVTGDGLGGLNGVVAVGTREDAGLTIGSAASDGTQNSYPTSFPIGPVCAHPTKNAGSPST